MDLSALTPYARVRMRQCGIRLDAVRALLEHGSERYVHFRGREIVFLDRKARARLARQSSDGARAAARVGSTYAIVGDDGIAITVGHRYRRLPRD